MMCSIIRSKRLEISEPFNSLYKLFLRTKIIRKWKFPLHTKALGTDMPHAVQTEFPVWALLPKKETGVTSFLSKYPDYDGRGVIIAILDSGVDPGAPGLQLTSDGKTKVIERFDCSGCGDVSTTTIAQVKQGFLTGLTGRKLKVPDSWTNPSGNYRLGIKNAFDLYPERLRERIREERKEKMYDHQQKMEIAEVVRSIGKFELKHTNKQNLPEEVKFEKEDLDAKLDILNMHDKKYNDLGPVYDCILFHDGSKWVACVDTSECGDLEKCRLLGEYSKTHEYAPLTPSDQLNFSINVHGDGDVLELVGLCSSHGTHVASIASACFPDSPERNGIAPGAQIVSLTIGDGRLGAMETGTALVRAIIKVMEMHKETPIHVINMSYGEHAHWSNAGRLGDLMNEVVNKYEVVWVASAGNHGPALSTIGTPPDISQDTIIGVGAYVSPDMMVAEYSMRQAVNGMPYTWSSRGPTIDGGFGVSICAPGGAITSVPNFTLRNSQLMNGTSMSSPHVAGSVAVLLSGLLQQKIPYSPYSVKRAVENSALFLEDVETFAQGNGLLQVDRAFNHLTEHHGAQERDIRFHVTCGSSGSKGIYVRSKNTQNSYEYSISVEPCFKNCDSVAVDSKINFNVKLVLVCKATYVSCPVHLDLANMARAFSVKLDTAALSPGIHTTSIEALDLACISKGPVFRVSITIIKPQPVAAPTYTARFDKVCFSPHTIKRHFFVPPENATWGVIRMQCTDDEQTGRFVLHCMQILPKQSCRSLETNKNFVVSNVETVQSFQVRGQVVLEVVVAKYWASLGDINISYSISFYGVKPNYPNLTLQAAEGISTVEITTLQGEEISPSVTFKNSVQILKPTDSKINPLSARDVIPKGRQIYELVLVYNFHLNKGTEVSPNFALLSEILYESEFESQLWMLYDSNKQLMGCGDAYPSKYSVKLEKGDYVIRLHVRHDKKEYLDKLVEIPMLLSQKLVNTITLDVYASHPQAVVGGKKASFGHTLSSTTVPLYLAPLTPEKVTSKLNNAATYLTGSVTYTKDELGKRVDSYQIKYVLHDSAKKPNKSVDKDKSKVEEYKEALRDLKISFLAKSDNPDNLYEELCQEFPDCLQLHTALLQALNPMDPKKQLPPLKSQLTTPHPQEQNAKLVGSCWRIISISATVLDNINQEALLAYFAIKTDQRPDAAKIKSAMEKQKNMVIECLAHKGIASCRLYQLTNSQADGVATSDKSVSLDGISKVWRALLMFVDPSDSKTTTSHVLYFACWHALTFGHYGRLLKFLLKLQEEKNCKEIDEKYIETCYLLGWTHLVKHFQSSVPLRFPLEYKPF